MATQASQQQTTQNAESKDQGLMLRVMRLSRPMFYSNFAFQGEVSDGFDMFQRSTVSSLKDNEGVKLCPTSESFALGDSLSLPKNFVQLYLGEAFVSYISTFNNTYQDGHQFGLKVEIQTQTQRFVLFDNTTTPIPRIPSGERYDTIVNYEVKEPGLHILVCNVTYSRPDGEKKQYRKFFKFNVISPLSVKTKTFTVQDQVFVEAHIQNSTHFPIQLDVVHFEPSICYSSVDLNKVDSAVKGPVQPSEPSELMGRGNDRSVFGEMFCLRPEEVRQYLFKVSPRAIIDRHSKSATTYGKIDVLWRQPMGALGRLQTNQLQKKVLATEVVEVSIMSLPPRIFLETPFTVQCLITNKSDKTISGRLSTNPTKMSGITVNGLSGKNLGEIASGSCKVIPLDLFPLVPGVQKITGLLIDIVGDRFYEADNLADVLVEEFASDEAPQPI